MTELTITPDYGRKRLKFAGTVAAGEHVAVTVAGAAEWASAEGAKLRLRVLFGKALVGIVGGDAEAQNPWRTHGDDPAIAEGAARCELNLNTIPAEKMLKCGGNCFWILDDATNHTLYGAGEWDVRAWPKRRGVDEPFDLDGYPQLVEDIEELKEAWEEYKATVSAALADKADRATTYTKGETDAAIAAAKNGRFKVVQELPSVAEAESNVIYLVPRTDGETGNVYDEWVVADGAWEKIGTADVDLTDYYNKSAVDGLLTGKVDKETGKGLSSNDYTTTEKQKLAGIEAGAQVNAVASVNSKTGAVTLSASDVGALGNTGNQILDGSISASNYLSAPQLIVGTSSNGLIFSQDDSFVYATVKVGGSTISTYKFPKDSLLDGDNGNIARLLDIYAAVQQIAPAWVSGTTYAADAKVSYNGVVYARKTSGSITSSANPASDTTNWQAKKVSELFLPLTGGTLSGSLLIDDRIIIGKIFGNPSIAIRAANGTSFVIFSRANIRINSDTLDYPISSGTLALLENIAPSFSDSATYEVNKLCVYANALYRCTTAITTAGAWDFSKWTTATVQDVLAAIWAALDNKAPLASPAFTGTPTAPNMDAQSADGQVANKKYVDDKVAGVSVTPLSGKTYDFSTNADVYKAVADIARALGATVTNAPTDPVSTPSND